ncbi:MAG: hypothetical protein ACI9G1_000195 [Pirellulaceae bacterium]|jgi:hypothetical protein
MSRHGAIAFGMQLSWKPRELSARFNVFMQLARTRTGPPGREAVRPRQGMSLPNVFVKVVADQGCSAGAKRR